MDVTLLLSDSKYFVMTGDLYVGKVPDFIQTTLGSCIAVVAWHPQLKVGGMCHYLIGGVAPVSGKLSGNYLGSTALQNMQNLIQNFDDVSRFRWSLYGGGSFMSKEKCSESVGDSNVFYAKDWANANRIIFSDVCVGGSACRTVCLSLKTGRVENKRYEVDGDVK